MLQRILYDVGTLAKGLWALRRPSLRTLVRKLHRDHLARNPEARALRYRPGRRLLEVIGARPVSAAGAVVIIYVVTTTMTAVAPPLPWGPQIPARVSDFYRDLQTVNFAILGAQTALIGLVFPLVIALVGLLFEARSSTGGRLQVYFRETEAAVVGLMSLALVGLLVLQGPMYSQLPAKVSGALTVLNCLWFIVNLSALGFFVYRSLEFIRPQPRLQLLRSFTANSAWRAQLREVMLLNQWHNAVLYGHLKPPAGHEANELVNPFLTREPLLTHTLKGPHELADVRFGLLAVLLERLEGYATEPSPQVTFQLRPLTTYKGAIALVQGQHVSLRWPAKLLLRLAFVFERARTREAPPESTALVQELVADLLGQVEAGRYDEFKARLEELIALHTLLYQLAQEPREPGKPTFSYAADEWRWGSLASAWSIAYRPILRRVADQLPAEPRFFEACCYLPSRLYARARKVAPFIAAQPLFIQSSILMETLLDGAARRRRPAAGGISQSVFTVDETYASRYREAWHDFVGAWEALLQEVTSPAEPAGAESWAALQGVGPAVRHHLAEAGMMVARAAKAGEAEAIGWTVDMLLKWRSTAGRGWDVHGHRGWAVKAHLVTLSVLDRSWDEIGVMGLHRGGDQPRPSDVLDAAFENAWLDTMVVLVSTLIALFGAPSGGMFTNGPAIAARKVFQNADFDPMAAAHPREPPLKTRGILMSILRLVGAGPSFEPGYGAQIGHIAERVEQLQGPNYISGRIYSWSGEADVHGQADPQVILLAASMEPLDRRRRRLPVQISPDLREVLVPDDDSDRRRMLEHVRSMSAQVAGADLARARDLVSTLVGKRISAPNLRGRLAAVDNLLDACESELTAARNAALAASTPDFVYLGALAEAAQGNAFAKDTGFFPVTVFGAVDISPAPLAKSIKATGLSHRGKYTTPVLHVRTDNEDDWWQQVLPPHVGQVVLTDVSGAKVGVRRRPRTPLGYWQALKQAIAAVHAAGQTPIVVHPSRAEPPFLLDWAVGDPPATPSPPDFALTGLNAREDGFDYLLNGTPVYSQGGVAGTTLVFGRESLERVVFERLPSGRLVDLRVVPDGTDPWQARIEIEFGREVVVGPGPLWRISHAGLA